MAQTVIDLDALNASAAPYRFRSRGREYVARPVSVEAVVQYEAAVRGASNLEVMAARKRLLRLAFPWRVSFLWRGDPVRLISQAPPAVYREVWADFFASLQSLPRSEGAE